MYRYKKIQSTFLYLVLAFYIILFFSIIVFKNVSPLELFDENRIFYRSYNLTPFLTIKSYLMGYADVSNSVSFNNIFGNIVLFIPLGIYLQLFKKNKKAVVSFILVFAISLLVEIVQFSFGIGTADIDDVLLNCLGGIIGILAYKLLAAFIKDNIKIRAIIAICSSIIGIPLLIIFVLLLVNN